MKNEEITKQNKVVFWIPLVFLPIVLTSLISRVAQLSPWWGRYIIYALTCWLTLTILWFILRKNGYSFKDIGWRNFRIKDIGWAVLFFIIAIYVWWGLSIVLGRFSIGWETNFPFANSSEVLIIFFYAIITAPICEEILFRGYLITVLSKKTILWLSGVISVILFALYHLFPFGIGAFIHILFWSPFPTILFIWRKSVYPGIIMHVLNNLWAYIVLPLLFRD